MVHHLCAGWIVTVRRLIVICRNGKLNCFDGIRRRGGWRRRRHLNARASMLIHYQMVCCFSCVNDSTFDIVADDIKVIQPTNTYTKRYVKQGLLLWIFLVVISVTCFSISTTLSSTAATNIHIIIGIVSIVIKLWFNIATNCTNICWCVQYLSWSYNGERTIPRGMCTLYRFTSIS
jgi:hypothetical protein